MNSRWSDFLGLNPDVSGAVVFILAIIFVSCVVVGPFYYLFSHIDRKLLADYQARIGPSLTGPSGLLQNVADIMKLLAKKPKSIKPKKQIFFNCVSFSILMSLLCYIPISDQLLLSNPEMGVWIFFLALYMHSFFRVFVGAQSSSLSEFLVGLRVGHRLISAAIPFGFALVCAGLSVRGWSWIDFANAQGFWIHHWLAFKSPFHFLAFFVFLVSGLILVEAPPFENERLPEGLISADLISGNRELLLEKISKIYSRFFIACFSVCVFLGGWNLPSWSRSLLGDPVMFRFYIVAQISVVLLKSLIVLILISWVSMANPRIRTDQIADLSWKFLAPLSAVAFVGVIIWEGWKHYL
jgi:NADH-quinone oxidoreductase subunit H